MAPIAVTGLAATKSSSAGGPGPPTPPGTRVQRPAWLRWWPWVGGLLVLFSHILKAPDGSAMYVAVLDGPLVLAASVLACAIGMLAALMPARRAARMDPVQAIRA